MDLTRLKEPFETSKVSWRAQSVVERGEGKFFALALAYIDARDVMERLDEACGVENWQCRYPHAGAKTCCEIGLKIGGEWVWKADGAGDTDVEADKGAFSDAFKRAAVKWGVAQYLYALEAPWVPCDAYKGNDGKWKFKRFLDDPWSCLKGPKPSPAKTFHGPLKITALKDKMRAIAGDLQSIKDTVELDGFILDNQEILEQAKRDLKQWYDGAMEAINKKRNEINAHEPDPRG